MVLLDEDGDGMLDAAAIGEEVEDRMLEVADAILTMIAVGDYVAEVLDRALDDFQKMLEKARKEFK